MFIAIHSFMKMMKKPKGHKMDLKTKSNQKVTLFVMSIVGLVSFIFSSNSFAVAADPIKPSIKKQISDYKLPALKKTEPDYKFAATVEVSRSTGLYDFKDGSRSDGLDLLFAPSLKTPIGNFSVKESYSKDLRNEESTSNGFSDATVGYNNGSFDWEWSAPYVLTLRPSLSVVIPVSNISVKKTQLQTAVSGSLSFGIRPDGLASVRGGAWNVGLSISAGRNFHAYEEDINGVVLNKYSSNQGVSIGYTISDLSFSFDYMNRSRWTYQGNIKQSFVISEEISYAINDNFYVSAGHTNDAGSVLKANGFESNIQIIDENNSGVYLTLGSSF
jgi:hypothetical protein